jgi:hypothetical protein
VCFQTFTNRVDLTHILTFWSSIVAKAERRPDMMELHQGSRGGRLDRRTARELEAAERDSLVDLAVSDGIARLAQTRIQNGVSLGY